MRSEEELRIEVNRDPGAPSFFELGELLRLRGDLAEGLLVCVKGLSRNPASAQGRLVLSRIFMDLGALTFAVRELEQLCVELPANKTIRRLLECIAPGSAGLLAKTEQKLPETVAETDFSFDELDAIESDSKK